MAATLGGFLGALIITFLLSRLFGWLLRNRLAGGPRIVTTHAITLVFVFVVAGFGLARGSGFEPSAIVVYLLPIAIWFGLDLYLENRRRSADAGRGAGSQ